MIIDADQKNVRDTAALKNALFEMMAQADYGTFFPYESLSEIIGEDIRKSYYMILSVWKRLEREAQRTLRCIAREGYCVAKPEEHVMLAMERHQRSRRQMRRGLAIAHATNRQALPQHESKRIDDIEILMRDQFNALRLVQRQTRH